MAKHSQYCLGTAEVRWKYPCNGKTVNCSEWSERTASSRLLVRECKWSANLGDECQFEPFRDGFWLLHIGLGVQPDVLGPLWSTGDDAVSRGGGTECSTSDNGDTVSLVMSPGSAYTTVTVGFGCAVGKGRGWLMPVPSLMMELVARQSWYGVQSTMGRGVSCSWWVEPWTGISTSRSWGIKCCHGRQGCFDVTLCTSKTMLCPIQHVTRQLFEHVWDKMSVWIRDIDDTPPPPPQPPPPPPPPPFHRSWTKQCRPPGVGCSSARKGADPGREHASLCQGSADREK